MHGILIVVLGAAILSGCLTALYQSVKGLGAAEATMEIRSELNQRSQEVDKFHEEIWYDYDEWEANEAETLEEVQEETQEYMDEVYSLEGPIHCPDLENYLDCELPWPEDK